MKVHNFVISMENYEPNSRQKQLWLPVGIYWHPFRTLFLNLFDPVPQRVFWEVPFSFWHHFGSVLVSFWLPVGSHLTSFWLPLVPFDFLGTPFRGS